jgi:glycine/D-amino acid oxidase-like deaminating enzyme
MATADIVICGAGIAGVSTAYHLAARHGFKNILLVDEYPPLSVTSSVGTEAYRNWWPGPGDTMVRFMNRSIDLLEDLANSSGNIFQLNRRGYVFLTSDPKQVSVWRETSAQVSALGAGPVREHPGTLPYPPFQEEAFDPALHGVDLVLDPELIRTQFAFITEKVVAMLHVRRCGWMSVRQVGAWLLEQAVLCGVQFKQDKLVAVDSPGGRIRSVKLASGETIQTSRLVIAAGPYLKHVGSLLGLDLPVVNELHGKISFLDSKRIISTPAPFMFWSDPVFLPWTHAERAHWAAHPETQWLLEEFPGGVQFRQRGQELLALWTFDVKTQEPVWPPHFEPHYAETVLRGLSVMVPGMAAYFDQPVNVDGGYYCKTRENRPLIGPLPIEGVFVIGALSGYGAMASQAAAELISAHITGSPLPEYAPNFRLERYEDPAYRALVANWDALSGQL